MTSPDEVERESGLLFPTLTAMNERGEVVFSMKRKGEKYDQLYYLFEIRWDRMDAKQIVKFNRLWEIIRTVAAQIGIPLYDANQVAEEIRKQLKRIPPGKTTDITIPVLDHATDQVQQLVICVTAKKLERGRRRRPS